MSSQIIADGIFHTGNGVLDFKKQRLKKILNSMTINEKYVIESTPLGSGSFGVVHCVTDKVSQDRFAAKFIKLPQIAPYRWRVKTKVWDSNTIMDEDLDSIMGKDLRHEIAILTICTEADAENIIRLIGVFKVQSKVAILMELAPGGTVHTILKNELRLNETQAQSCIRQVLCGLRFLHQHSIVHLDLKPLNFLLTGEHIEDGIKLCDFGNARVLLLDSNVYTEAGTTDFIAPELLKYEAVSLATDIWSLGVCAYVLLSGYTPFAANTRQEIYKNIKDGALHFPADQFHNVSNEAFDFIRLTICLNPSDRMTVDECLQHVWLKEKDDTPVTYEEEVPDRRVGILRKFYVRTKFAFFKIFKRSNT